MAFVVDQLSLLGLNENEVRVFTALATFGRMNMTDVAGRSGLPRTTVDAIVRRLIEQGVVTREKVGKHWEYAVGTQELAARLDALEQKLVATGSREPVERTDEIFVTPTYTVEQVIADVAARGTERGLVLVGDSAYAADIALQIFRIGSGAGVLFDLVLHKSAEGALREAREKLLQIEYGASTQITYIPDNLMRESATLVVCRDVVYIFGGEVFHVERHFRTVEMFHLLLHAARESGWTTDLKTHVESGVVQSKTT